MTWTKVDDGLWAHRKVAELLERDLGRSALGLWVLALSWCGRELTDGYVPARQLVRLAGDDVTAEAGLLVEVGLWEREEAGYRFHEFLVDEATGSRRNPSREEVLAGREEARDRMAKLRRERSGERSTEPPGERSSSRSRERAPDVQGVPNPVSRTPIPESPGPAPSRASDVLDEVEGFFAGRDVKINRANGHGEELRAIVGRHGVDRVIEVLEALPPMPTFRQYVFAARDALDPPIRASAAASAADAPSERERILDDAVRRARLSPAAAKVMLADGLPLDGRIPDRDGAALEALR